MQCWYSDRKFPYREKSPKVPQCASGTSLTIPNALPSWSYQYSPYFGLFAPLRGQNHYLGPKQPSCQSQYCIFWYGWKPIQKWKMVKTKVNSIIFEGCWIYKSGLRILVWALKVPYFCTQKWAVWQKCPFLRAQKWHFGCPNENSEITFISQTSPKNDGIDFSFKHLPLLDGFSAISKYAKLSSLCLEGCLRPN